MCSKHNTINAKKKKEKIKRWVDYTLSIEQFINAFNDSNPISPPVRVVIGDLHILIMVENCKYNNENKLKFFQRLHKHVMKANYKDLCNIPNSVIV